MLQKLDSNHKSNRLMQLASHNRYEYSQKSEVGDFDIPSNFTWSYTSIGSVPSASTCIELSVIQHLTPKRYMCSVHVDKTMRVIADTSTEFR